jgi:hypothetical protein
LKKVFILGSCVSRDAINTADPLEFRLAAYYARSSFASLSGQPVVDLPALASIESNFQRRMVAADMDKSVLQEVQKGDYDILLVDFIDERFNVLKISDEQIVTISNEYKKAKNGSYQGKVLSNLSAEKFVYWKHGFDRFVDILKCSGHLSKLKILKVFWSDKTSNGVRIDAYTEDYISQQNKYLNELYAYVSATLGSHYLVSFSDEDLMSDEDHRWGLEPFHYVPEFYRKVLCKIYNSESKQGNFIAKGAVSQAKSLNREYASISKNSVRAENGRNLVESNLLKLPFFDEFQLQDTFDWEMDPFKNRTWQWQLNCFFFITDIIAYDCKAPNGANVLKAISLIKSWGTNFLDTCYNSTFEFAWHDHGSAMRVEQILLLIRHVEERHYGFFDDYPEVYDYLSHFLYVHANFLVQDRFYSRHTNHGIEQSRVLLLLSIVLKCSFFSENWKQVAIERLNSELNFSFTSEGVHVENSPAYHYFVLKIFLQVIADYSDCELGQLAANFEDIARKALYFLTFIIQPDGALPIIGDTEAVKVGNVFEEYFSGMPEYQYYLYAHSQGRTGSPAPVNYHICRESGYGIVRSRWSRRDKYRQDSHLIFKAGCISQYHSQQDDGNILYYARGEHWLVDSGMFNHNRSSPVRKYMRSRQAHNVVHVTTASYASVWQEVKESWHLEAECASEPMFSVLHSNVYQGVELSRRISWEDGNDSFQVIDEIKVREDDTHDVEIIWHFDSNKSLIVENDNSFIIHSEDSQNKLRLSVTHDQEFEYAVWKGTSPQHGMSLVSKKKNVVEDSLTLKIIFRQVSGNRRVQFGFSFESEC